VRVDDDGRGCAEVVPGIGLSGMRERVIALGGSLRTGPRPGGGFSVRAELPLVAPTNGAT
jgi:signal transduction histidine kinase